MTFLALAEHQTSKATFLEVNVTARDDHSAFISAWLIVKAAVPDLHETPKDRLHSFNPLSKNSISRRRRSVKDTSGDKKKKEEKEEAAEEARYYEALKNDSHA